MNKKYLALSYIILLSIGTIFSLGMPKQETAEAADTLIIPDEAIRLRILANSDEPGDQAVKRKIRDEVNQDITGWVQNLTSIEEARKVIISHLPEIQQTADEVISREGLSVEASVTFGEADFPTKLYGQFLYPAGQYEAVVVTLGKGEGANWWCVLFPPLCFLDFSNGTAVSQSPIQEEPDADKEAVVSEPSSSQEKIDDEKVEEIETEAAPDAQTGESSGAGEVYKSEEEQVVVKSFFAQLVKDLF